VPQSEFDGDALTTIGIKSALVTALLEHGVYDHQGVDDQRRCGERLTFRLNTLAGLVTVSISD
jgi:hypothetical protein